MHNYLFWSYSEVVDGNLCEAWEPDACHLSVLRASQVLSKTGKCGHAVVERLKLGEFRESRHILTLCDLLGVIDLFEKEEVGQAGIRTCHELSVIGENFSTTCFESTKGLLAELLSRRFGNEDELDKVHHFVLEDVVELRDLGLFGGCVAEQLWLELVANVPLNCDSLSHVDITINEEGQVGEINGSSSLDSGPFFAAHGEHLVLPLSSAVSEQVARTVSSVKTSEFPVTKLDFVTSCLCHSVLS